MGVSSRYFGTTVPQVDLDLSEVFTVLQEMSGV